jgi:hypothetical protein
MMNTTHWGRKETIIFPPHSPVYSYGAIFFALILTSIFVYLRFSYGQTPLQQFYTPIYAKSAAGGALNRKGKYQLLYVGDGAKFARLATESDVQEGVTSAPNGKHIPRRGSIFFIAARSRPSSMRRSMPTSALPSSAAISSAASMPHRSSSASFRCSRNFRSPSAKTSAAVRN